ncbi:LysE family transporter [Streptomyces sp. NPDC012935]|uniref:LysE family transporter n=1 Tax=Streptomyces sp. NPDC012935 TaxID=3364857 RepID=UPI00368EF0C9
MADRPGHNVLNPKIIVHTGLLPALAPPRLPAAWSLTLLVLPHAVLSRAWLGTYVFLLSRARRVLETPRTRRALGLITGVALIGLGLALATASG